MTFVTWVLVGLLGGLLAGLVVKRGGYGLKTDVILGLVGSIGVSLIVRAVGVPSGRMIVTAVIAFIGAAVPIVAQRRFWPTQLSGEDKVDMWWRGGLGAALVAAVAWMTFGPAQQPVATAAVIEDKTYAVTPASMTLKAGVIAGEVVDMKVTERVEQGSGRVSSPAKLTGTLRLKNTSTNQTVRLVEGKIQYLDAQGKPITLEDARAEPTFKFSTSGSERLDPGQEATQSLDLEFPAEALKAKKLKEIRLALVYIPSPYREEMVNFAVSIGAAGAGRP